METGNQVRLGIENLSLSFGGVRALSEVSLDIRNNDMDLRSIQSHFI